jgi:hypothetical protein
MAKKSYVAETRLGCDGVDFMPGDPVELDEKIAAPLVASGVLIPKAEAEARKKAAEQGAQAPAEDTAAATAPAEPPAE